MAKVYALPTLMDLNSATGWSNTSGGPDRGQALSATEDLIVFDANSGPSRTVTMSGGSKTVRGISTLGANPMVFSGTGEISLITSTLEMAGMTSWGIPLLFYGVNTLRAGNTPMGKLWLRDFNGTYTLIIDGGVTCTSLEAPADNGGNARTIRSINGGTIKVPFVALGAGCTLDLGSATWELTADSGTVLSAGSITGGTATIKPTGGGTLTKTIPGLISSSSGVTMWNATTGTGGLTLFSTNTYGTFRASAGSKTLLQASTTLTATSFDVDAAGGSLTIQSTSATRANVTKAGGGSVDFRYASLKDLNFSPVSTFFGIQCTNLGNNANFTFRANSTGFMPFF